MESAQGAKNAESGAAELATDRKESRALRAMGWGSLMGWGRLIAAPAADRAREAPATASSGPNLRSAAALKG